jgi:hypothetical protein
MKEQAISAEGAMCMLMKKIAIRDEQLPLMHYGIGSAPDARHRSDYIHMSCPVSLYAPRPWDTRRIAMYLR